MQALKPDWGKWWQVPRHHPALEWPPELGETPPPPKVDYLKRVLMSFKAITGAGFDQCSPRLFLLPDEALAILCDLTGAGEGDLAWPAAWIRIVCFPTSWGRTASWTSTCAMSCAM
eukprot:8366274-Pyramimonas_sp.AAC.1